MAAANSTGTAQKLVPGRPFPKGKSGNPNGRPKIITEVRDLAREHTEASINTLVAIAGSSKMPASARVTAAIAILDRGWGKATQAHEHGGLDGKPIPTKLEIEFLRSPDGSYSDTGSI